MLDYLGNKITKLNLYHEIGGQKPWLVADVESGCFLRRVCKFGDHKPPEKHSILGILGKVLPASQ